MTEAILRLAGIVVAGVALGWLWEGPVRSARPRLPDTAWIRARIGQLVLNLLLPALVFRAMALAPIGRDLWGVPLAAALSLGASLGAAWLVYDRLALRHRWLDRPAAGALLLASAWSNATYLGLPVVSALFGSGIERVPLLFDLLALTPLLLTVGAAIGNRYGKGDRRSASVLRSLVGLPPLHAALLGLLLNLSGLGLPEILDGLCRAAGTLVSPLMLLSLGLAIRLRGAGRLPLVAPALAIKLGLAPLVAWLLVPWVGLSGDVARATVLEAAMPSMVLPLVIADRHRLDTGLLALAIAASTLVSFVILALYTGVV
jgi:hypothetical protein